MKAYGYFSLAVLVVALAACSKGNNSSSDGGDQRVQSDGWTAYSDSALSGKVFGQDWSATNAILRPFGTDKKEISVEFYSDSVASVCKNFQARKPYASVTIPADYTTTEYRMDLNTGSGGGNPLVFSSPSDGQNLIADKTKIRVNALNATGFEASVYAQGTDEKGTSEINGKIQVTDCSKVVDFSAWDELSGWFNLTSFDGKSVTPRTSIIQYDTQRFYDRASSRYVKTLAFTLYEWVGDNSDSGYNFGPMEGLGQSSITEQNGQKTFTYSYHGAINFRGQDITLNLDLTAVKSGNTITVTYTIEVPNNVKKTTHSFVLSK